MRELDRDRKSPQAPTAQQDPSFGEQPVRAYPATRHSITVIGAGRAGTVLSKAFIDAGHSVTGPLQRGQALGENPEIVFLCVSDDAIRDVAAAMPAEAIVGHCCGAHGAELLGVRGGFSLHPLMTITEDSKPAALADAFASVDGTTEAMLELAHQLAASIGMRSTRIAPEDRPAYHAAASIASNFLVTVEAAAEELAAQAGLPREALVPLVRATVENWASKGSAGALTGPIARGDEATVARQRAAVEERAPQLMDLFDSLCEATRELSSPKVTS